MPETTPSRLSRAMDKWMPCVLWDLFRKPCWDHRGATGAAYGVVHYEDLHGPGRGPWVSRFVWHRNLYPWFGGDEWCRYTLVVPLIFTSLVVPLWSCRDPECFTCAEFCPGDYDWTKAIPASVYFADDFDEATIANPPSGSS